MTRAPLRLAHDSSSINDRDDVSNCALLELDLGFYGFSFFSISDSFSPGTLATIFSGRTQFKDHPICNLTNIMAIGQVDIGVWPAEAIITQARQARRQCDYVTSRPSPDYRYLAQFYSTIRI